MIYCSMGQRSIYNYSMGTFYARTCPPISVLPSRDGRVEGDVLGAGALRHRAAAAGPAQHRSGMGHAAPNGMQDGANKTGNGRAP